MKTLFYQQAKNLLLLQRKLLLLGLSVSLLLNLLLTSGVCFLAGREKVIIMPPAITQEIWAKGSRFSDSYLEEMASYWGELLLTVNNNNMQSRMDYLLKNVAPNYYVDFKTLLAEQADKVVSKGFASSFFPMSFQVDSKKLRVRIVGELRTFYGSKEFDKNKKAFLMGFVIKNGRLFIKSFAEDGNA